MRYTPQKLAIICCALVLLWMGSFYSIRYLAALYARQTQSSWPFWAFHIFFGVMSAALLFFLLFKAYHSGQYKRLYQMHPIPMWIYEKDTLRFLSVNHAAVNTYGYTEKEFRQLTIKDIRESGEIDKLMDNVRINCSGAEYRGIWQHRKKNGETFYVEIYAHPGYYMGKDVRVIMAHNIDREVKAADAANELNRRYELLANMTNDAIYEWDLETNKLTWNHGLFSLFGYDPGPAAVTMEWLEQRLHPEEKERVLKLWYEFISGNSRQFQEEYRFLCADGSYKYVRNRAYLVSDGDNPLRLLGAVHDIDNLMQINRQLRNQNMALREIAWINSHEIRSPVVSILSITQLFDKNNEDPLLNGQLMDWLYKVTIQLDEVIHKIERKVNEMQ